MRCGKLSCILRYRVPRVSRRGTSAAPYARCGVPAFPGQRVAHNYPKARRSCIHQVIESPIVISQSSFRRSPQNLPQTGCLWNANESEDRLADRDNATVVHGMKIYPGSIELAKLSDSDPAPFEPAASRVRRHWAWAGVPICLCRALCRIGRPLSFASASPAGAAHRLFDRRDVRHIAGTSKLHFRPACQYPAGTGETRRGGNRPRIQTRKIYAKSPKASELLELPLALVNCPLKARLRRVGLQLANSLTRNTLSGTFGMRCWNASGFADNTGRVNKGPLNIGLR